MLVGITEIRVGLGDLELVAHWLTQHGCKRSLRIRGPTLRVIPEWQAERPPASSRFRLERDDGFTHRPLRQQNAAEFVVSHRKLGT